MLKIVVITTDGCLGCKILWHNVIKATDCLNSHGIEVEKKDISLIDKNFLKEYKVTDFPALFLIKDNKVVYSSVGSDTVENIKSKIRNYF